MANEKTPEQLEEEKRLAKAAKDEEKRLANEAKAAEKAEKKRLQEEDRTRKAQEKAAAKEAEKLAKEAAKVANEMPESNGIRRPKPDTACGKAWAIFDGVSQETSAPATMAEVLRRGLAQGLNEATIRTQYARWRKFFGISGRLPDPTAEAEKAAKAKAKEDEKAAKKAAKEAEKATKEAEKLAKKQAEAEEKARLAAEAAQAAAQ